MGWLGSAIPDPKPRKVPILSSYAYLRNMNDGYLRPLIEHDRIEFLVDSGAFTAFNSGSEIELTEYMAFLHKWEKHLFGYMALDRLQDPVTTDANLRIMLADGLRPVPIHVFGDDGPRMDWLFQHSDWVACGGLRRPHRGAAPPEYVKQKMEWANGRNVHWLGYTDQAAIRAYGPYSVDCASVKSSPMYGQMHVYSGSGRMKQLLKGEWLSLAGQSRRTTRGQVAALGFDPARFDRDDAWRDTGSRALFELAARSWVLYSCDVRSLVGTRFFLAAVATATDIKQVLSAIDWAQSVGRL